MREAAGFRMGPFELMDLTGLDVSQPVMESIYHQYYQEPRYRPSPIAAQRLTGGLLGRKTGRGFYDYADGKDAVACPRPPPDPARPRLGQPDPSGMGRPACARSPPAGIAVESDYVPGSDALVHRHPARAPTPPPPASSRASTRAHRRHRLPVRHPRRRHARRSLMTTPLTTPAMRDAAHALFAADGTPSA
jgi:3-hydroxybutyryl-CoA dehydrogenase